MSKIKIERSHDKGLDWAKSKAEEHAEKDADDLLLEPTEWSARYHQLKTYFDRKGHTHLKRNVSEDDIKGMTTDEAEDARALSRWTCQQRKLKKSGELDHYKIVLLNRLSFDWEPKTGHGPGEL